MQTSSGGIKTTALVLTRSLALGCARRAAIRAEALQWTVRQRFGEKFVCRPLRIAHRAPSSVPTALADDDEAVGIWGSTGGMTSMRQHNPKWSEAKSG